MDAQFLSRPFVVGDRIDITSAGGTKLATGCVEQVDPIYTQLRSDTGLPVTIPNKARPHTSGTLFKTLEYGDGLCGAGASALSNPPSSLNPGGSQPHEPWHKPRGPEMVAVLLRALPKPVSMASSPHSRRNLHGS